MPIDAEQLKTLLGTLGGQIKDVLVANAKEFLDDEKAAGQDFLKEEVKDAAYWALELAKAKDDAQKTACQAQLDRVKDRTIDALLAAAVNTSKKTRSTLKAVAQVAFEFIKQALPQIIGILAALA